MDSEKVGSFLEQKAKLGNPINYTDVVNAFPDCPCLSGSWHGHPLCPIFGILDEEDHAANRPWRTALVVCKGENRPGNGFFEAIARLRGTVTEDKDAIWTHEYERLIDYYANSQICHVRS